MERKMGWLTSGAFAALCDTTKETLRHYKDLGLLAPAHRGGRTGTFTTMPSSFTTTTPSPSSARRGRPWRRSAAASGGQDAAGTYLYLCCRGRWDLTQGYAALARHLADRGLETAGRVYACDLAGFILNGVEENAATMLSARLAE